MENMNVLNATIGKMLMDVNMNEEEQKQIDTFFEMTVIEFIDFLSDFFKSNDVPDEVKNTKVKELFNMYLNLEDKDEEDEIE